VEIPEMDDSPYQKGINTYYLVRINTQQM